MYIFELVEKLKNKKKESVASQKPIPSEETVTAEICRHILVPIDSTKSVLACSKCGFLIRRENLPKRTSNTAAENSNFFKKD